jgi:hypothetical protein
MEKTTIDNSTLSGAEIPGANDKTIPQCLDAQGQNYGTQNAQCSGIFPNILAESQGQFTQSLQDNAGQLLNWKDG